tara:strand:+ start:290 stop:511 length:222 start_codon:yes stop_codon:yes gene_type:complete
MTKNIKTYYNCQKKRRQIDELLHANSAYQAQNTCRGNTVAQKKEVNRYCNRKFLFPIKEIDPKFYDSIKIQSD